MTKTENNLYKKLETFDNICFGPIVSEAGWELMILSGFIKKYKKDNPNKIIAVLTRYDRKDLYKDSDLDYIFTFEILGDYINISPRSFNLIHTPENKTNHNGKRINSDDLFENEKLKIIDKYGFFNFIHFDNLKFMTEPDFSLKEYDYNFNNKDGKDIISNLIKNNPNKIPITIFTRHRLDMTHRNWSIDQWIKLLQNLDESNKYLIFISGIEPSYIKPPENLNNVIDLNSISNLSEFEITCEAIKQSKFTFGPQTFGILLSNVLKIPTIYFGNEDHLIDKYYNPFKNITKIIRSKYNKDYTYNVSFIKILEEIDKFYEEL